MYVKIYLPAQINAGWQIHVIAFIQETVPEPSWRKENEDIRRAGLSILLLSCSALFTFLLKLPSSTGGVSCPTLSLSTSLTCHGSDTSRFPSSAGRFSLSDHQYFIPRRKIMLGTDSNQVYIPWPASYSRGAGGRKGERTGSPLITTSFRSASSSTD